MKRSPVALPTELRRIQQQIESYARGYGLDFFDVIFEMLDWRQINEVASYGGFPNRYPHWRFGMEYERLSKSYSYGLAKIYEMVINNDPCYAYLLHSNHLVDQKLVMAHVYAHCDFFKNNFFFRHTNRKMMDEMANHKTRVMRYVDRFGPDRVEDLIDACLSLDSLIDYHAPQDRHRKPPVVRVEDEDGVTPVVRKIRGKAYMDKFINPPGFMAAEQKKIDEELKRARHFPEHPERDVMGFLLEYAPLEGWERDVLSIIREEAYYFAPQGQTKIMNEGWACVTGETRIITDRGSLSAREIVEQQLPVKVFDGAEWQKVIDWAHFPQRKTIRIRTRRGYIIEGSTTHQILSDEAEKWQRLDALKVGGCITVGVCDGAWPIVYQGIQWQPQRRMTLEDVAEASGVNVSTVIRYRAGTHATRNVDSIASVAAEYDKQFVAMPFMVNKREPILVPAMCDDRLGRFLGYLIGDGHISRVKRVLGLTTGDTEPKHDFAMLGQELFGLDARVTRDDGRWRILFHSEDLADFLVHLGLTHGPSAREKAIPEIIWRSPRMVVKAFLQAYFDCDAHAGPQGVILSTFSDALAMGVQQLLLQFGVVSRRRRAGGGWHVHITGHAATRYATQIGFGILRKKTALEAYLLSHAQWKREDFTDEVVDIKVGMQDVYDFTVETTHRYVAQGFVNHNSFWHSTMMTQKILTDAEVIDYADHHSGTVAMSPGQLNPYKIGIELLRDIEERWNKGRFGKEYDECEDMVKKAKWDLKLGLGREKIFEVRKLYNDVMFIDEFLTPEFCRQHKLFVYAYNATTDQYEIQDRTFEKIKKQMLFQLTNFGYPIIAVVDANYGNRGELLLRHSYEGVDLREDYAKETLKALVKIWRRPVGIETLVDGVAKILRFDGEQYELK